MNVIQIVLAQFRLLQRGRQLWWSKKKRAGRFPQKPWEADEPCDVQVGTSFKHNDVLQSAVHDPV